MLFSRDSILSPSVASPKLHMRYLCRLSILVCLAPAFVAAALAQTPNAEVKANKKLSLAPIFSDHMVLQRHANVPVWGRAAIDSKVTVRLGNDVQEALPDREGNWKATFKSLQVSAEPLELLVQAGDERLVLTDILVGDVWLASGQSNMEWPLEATDDSEKEISLANWPALRLVVIPRRTSETPQDIRESIEWRPCTAEAVRDFSAVGYFFGRSLQRDLDVPIGIISCNFGASRIEAWMSRESIQGGSSDGKSLRSDAKTAELLEHQQPSRLFHGMLSPLIPFGIRGVIWYQGENNAADYRSYAKLSRRMIEDWRQRWGQGEFPFLFVQLAAYETGGEDWAYLREAQQETLGLKNTGMVVTTDIGSRHDVHPRNKRDVGERLALVARKVAYAEDVLYSGPMFRAATMSGDKATISFNHVGEGLRAEGPLKGFEVSTSGGPFAPVAAEITGSVVTLTLENVQLPTRIRYNWAAYPEGNLFNAGGLPAAPFRTDVLRNRR